MLERVVTRFLRSYLGEYIVDLRDENVRLSWWNGRLALSNVTLDADELSTLIPPSASFTIAHGTIEELCITVPWTRLLFEPIHVEARGVRLSVVQQIRAAPPRSPRSPAGARRAASPSAGAGTPTCDSPRGIPLSYVQRIIAFIEDTIRFDVVDVSIEATWDAPLCRCSAVLSASGVEVSACSDALRSGAALAFVERCSNDDVDAHAAVRTGEQIFRLLTGSGARGRRVFASLLSLSVQLPGDDSPRAIVSVPSVELQTVTLRSTGDIVAFDWNLVDCVQACASDADLACLSALFGAPTSASSSPSTASVATPRPPAPLSTPSDLRSSLSDVSDIDSAVSYRVWIAEAKLQFETVEELVCDDALGVVPFPGLLVSLSRCVWVSCGDGAAHGSVASAEAYDQAAAKPSRPLIFFRKENDDKHAHMIYQQPSTDGFLPSLGASVHRDVGPEPEGRLAGNRQSSSPESASLRAAASPRTKTSSCAKDEHETPTNAKGALIRLEPSTCVVAPLAWRALLRCIDAWGSHADGRGEPARTSESRTVREGEFVAAESSARGDSAETREWPDESEPDAVGQSFQAGAQYVSATPSSSSPSPHEESPCLRFVCSSADVYLPRDVRDDSGDSLFLAVEDVEVYTDGSARVATCSASLEHGVGGERTLFLRESAVDIFTPQPYPSASVRGIGDDSRDGAVGIVLRDGDIRSLLEIGDAVGRLLSLDAADLALDDIARALGVFGDSASGESGSDVTSGVPAATPFSLSGSWSHVDGEPSARSDGGAGILGVPSRCAPGAWRSSLGRRIRERLLSAAAHRPSDTATDGTATFSLTIPRALVELCESNGRLAAAVHVSELRLTMADPETRLAIAALWARDGEGEVFASLGGPDLGAAAEYRGKRASTSFPHANPATSGGHGTYLSPIVGGIGSPQRSAGSTDDSSKRRGAPKTPLTRPKAVHTSPGLRIPLSSMPRSGASTKKETALTCVLSAPRAHRRGGSVRVVLGSEVRVRADSIPGAVLPFLVSPIVGMERGELAEIEKWPRRLLRWRWAIARVLENVRYGRAVRAAANARALRVVHRGDSARAWARCCAERRCLLARGAEPTDTAAAATQHRIPPWTTARGVPALAVLQYGASFFETVEVAPLAADVSLQQGKLVCRLRGLTAGPLPPYTLGFVPASYRIAWSIDRILVRDASTSREFLRVRNVRAAVMADSARTVCDMAVSAISARATAADRALIARILANESDAQRPERVDAVPAGDGEWDAANENHGTPPVRESPRSTATQPVNRHADEACAKELAAEASALAKVAIGTAQSVPSAPPWTRRVPASSSRWFGAMQSAYRSPRAHAQRSHRHSTPLRRRRSSGGYRAPHALAGDERDGERSASESGSAVESAGETSRVSAAETSTRSAASPGRDGSHVTTDQRGSGSSRSVATSQRGSGSPRNGHAPQQSEWRDEPRMAWARGDALGHVYVNLGVTLRVARIRVRMLPEVYATAENLAMTIADRAACASVASARAVAGPLRVSIAPWAPCARLPVLTGTRCSADAIPAAVGPGENAAIGARVPGIGATGHVDIGAVLVSAADVGEVARGALALAEALAVPDFVSPRASLAAIRTHAAAARARALPTSPQRHLHNYPMPSVAPVARAPESSVRVSAHWAAVHVEIGGAVVLRCDAGTVIAPDTAFLGAIDVAIPQHQLNCLHRVLGAHETNGESRFSVWLPFAGLRRGIVLGVDPDAKRVTLLSLSSGADCTPGTVCVVSKHYRRLRLVMVDEHIVVDWDDSICGWRFCGGVDAVAVFSASSSESVRVDAPEEDERAPRLPQPPRDAQLPTSTEPRPMRNPSAAGVRMALSHTRTKGADAPVPLPQMRIRCARLCGAVVRSCSPDIGVPVSGMAPVVRAVWSTIEIDSDGGGAGSCRAVYGTGGAMALAWRGRAVGISAAGTIVLPSCARAAGAPQRAVVAPVQLWIANESSIDVEMRVRGTDGPSHATLLRRSTRRACALLSSQLEFRCGGEAALVGARGQARAWSSAISVADLDAYRGGDQCGLLWVPVMTREYPECSHGLVMGVQWRSREAESGADEVVLVDPVRVRCAPGTWMVLRARVEHGGAAMTASGTSTSQPGCATTHSTHGQWEGTVVERSPSETGAPRGEDKGAPARHTARSRERPTSTRGDVDVQDEAADDEESAAYCALARVRDDRDCFAFCAFGGAKRSQYCRTVGELPLSLPFAGVLASAALRVERGAGSTGAAARASREHDGALGVCIAPACTIINATPEKLVVMSENDYGTDAVVLAPDASATLSSIANRLCIAVEETRSRWMSFPWSADAASRATRSMLVEHMCTWCKLRANTRAGPSFETRDCPLQAGADGGAGRGAVPPSEPGTTRSERWVCRCRHLESLWVEITDSDVEYGVAVGVCAGSGSGDYVPWSSRYLRTGDRASDSAGGRSGSAPAGVPGASASGFGAVIILAPVLRTAAGQNRRVGYVLANRTAQVHADGRACKFSAYDEAACPGCGCDRREWCGCDTLRLLRRGDAPAPSRLSLLSQQRGIDRCVQLVICNRLRSTAVLRVSLYRAADACEHTWCSEVARGRSVSIRVARDAVDGAIGAAVLTLSGTAGGRAFEAVLPGRTSSCGCAICSPATIDDVDVGPPVVVRRLPLRQHGIGVVLEDTCSLCGGMSADVASDSLRKRTARGSHAVVCVQIEHLDLVLPTDDCDVHAEILGAHMVVDAEECGVPPNPDGHELTARRAFVTGAAERVVIGVRGDSHVMALSGGRVQCTLEQGGNSGIGNAPVRVGPCTLRVESASARVDPSGVLALRATAAWAARLQALASVSQPVSNLKCSTMSSMLPGISFCDFGACGCTQNCQHDSGGRASDHDVDGVDPIVTLWRDVLVEISTVALHIAPGSGILATSPLLDLACGIESLRFTPTIFEAPGVLHEHDFLAVLSRFARRTATSAALRALGTLTILGQPATALGDALRALRGGNVGNAMQIVRSAALSAFGIWRGIYQIARARVIGPLGSSPRIRAADAAEADEQGVAVVILYRSQLPAGFYGDSVLAACRAVDARNAQRVVLGVVYWNARMASACAGGEVLPFSYVSAASAETARGSAAIVLYGAGHASARRYLCATAAEAHSFASCVQICFAA